jgi:hypothetical protein
MERREYTKVEKRKALSAAYKMLSDGHNQSRYAGTLFGLTKDGNDEPIYLGDVMNCLAMMHNEMKASE